jgi:putative endonuclease
MRPARSLYRRLHRALRRTVWEQTRWLKRCQSPTLGERGETAALRYLLDRGFDVVARNVRIGGGELDLVAYEGDTLVIVEVKTRSRHDAFPPQRAVHRAKEEQIVRLASAFCHRYGLETVPLRFDVIAVTLEEGCRPEIQHFQRAF